MAKPKPEPKRPAFASKLLVRLRRDAGMIATALVASAGFVTGAYLLGDALPRAKRADHTVTVRGVAERDVLANLAVWTLSFSATAPNLAQAQAQVDRNAGAIRAFFRKAGFAEDALQTTGVNVAREIENKQPRYVVRQRITLRTTDIARAEDAVHRQFELVRRGVFLEDGSKVSFIYTGLAKVKPQMVADATRDARASAEQFARDAGTTLAGIRQASQGYFELGARDGDQSDGWGEAQTPHKKLRVVTTVSYILK